MLTTVQDVIDHFGGARSLAKMLGVSDGYPAVWKNRGHIPPKFADYLRGECVVPITSAVFAMYGS